MTAPEARSGIFYGWYIVGACFLIMMIVAGSGATFPVFFKPLVTEFDWSRTALAGTVSVSLIVGGLVTPFWGNWTDRSGARVVVATAAFFAGLSLLLRSQITTLWHLYLLSILGSLFFAGIGLIPLSATISHWFKRKRGVAMGVTLVGGGVGGLLTPPIANYLVVSIGWRNAYLLLGGFLCATIVPIAALVLRRRPQDLGLLPDGEALVGTQGDGARPEENADAGQDREQSSGEGITLKQAARSLAFWMIAIAFFLPMMAGVGLATHLVAMFTDMGMSSQRAAACLGVMGGLSIVGRFGFGCAADRFSVRKVFTACFTVEAIGVGTLLATPLLGTTALYAYVLIYGLAGGGGLVLAPLIVGQCFGITTLGTVFGVLVIAAVVGGAIGPLLSGFIFDTTGSYYLAFVIFTCGEVAAAAAISQAKTARVSVP